MVALAFATGAVVALRPTPPRADLELWLASISHQRVFEPHLSAFTQRTGRSVAIQLISGGALATRLQSMFLGGRNDPGVPDLVQFSNDYVGSFFRPPAEGMGLIPLDRYLDRDGERTIADGSAAGQAGWCARNRADGLFYVHDGSAWNHDAMRTKADHWRQRILANRCAAWAKEGQVFGIPFDVHPVALAYREDLFREAGIDLAAATTWDAFHRCCSDFERYWSSHGVPRRHAIELTDSGPTQLAPLLLQRGINLVDADGRLHLADPLVAETVARYARMVAGERRIGWRSAGATQILAQEMARGELCACLCPDWRVFYLKQAPSLAGRLRLMPLPTWAATDGPTTTWGGTMLGITRACRDPEAAWRLIELLYLSDEVLDARKQISSIYPPLPERFTDPTYHREDSFFGGQRIDELYLDLIPRIPAAQTTAFTALATEALTLVLNRACVALEQGADGDLVADCQRWLDDAAVGVAARIAHTRYAP